MSVDLHYGSPNWLTLTDYVHFFTFGIIQKLRARSSKFPSLRILRSTTLLLLFAISAISAQLLPHMNNP